MFDPVEVRTLVERLRAADSQCTVFGANGHRYAFNRPIEKAKLIEWERARSVELPHEYRTFLLELGNGGAGPDYGIFPLGFWDAAGRQLEPYDDAVGDLSAPFPHEQAWNLPAERLEPPVFDDEDHEDAWNAALDREYYDRALMNGACWIADQGCALRTVLVLTGSQRGTIWDDLRPDGEGLVPRTQSDGRSLTFGDWYMSWLHDSLRTAS